MGSAFFGLEMGIYYWYMPRVAKLFWNGRSQAVRLPVEFRFSTKSVSIRRDPATGEVILSPRPDSWEDWFELCDQIPLRDRERFGKFIAELPDPVPERGDPLEGWKDWRVVGPFLACTCWT